MKFANISIITILSKFINVFIPPTGCFWCYIAESLDSKYGPINFPKKTWPCLKTKENSDLEVCNVEKIGCW